jgi:hypothetical protein
VAAAEGLARAVVDGLVVVGRRGILLPWDLLGWVGLWRWTTIVVLPHSDMLLCDGCTDVR